MPSGLNHARPVFLLAIFLLLAACGGEPDIGAAIHAKYESSLDRLPLTKQKHYSLRMYRITGKARYLPPIMEDALRDVETLQRNIAHLGDPAYRRERAAAIVANYWDHNEKYRRRKDLLSRSGEFPFAKSLLYYVHQAYEYELIGRPPLQDVEPAMAYLRKVDWAGFWLAPETLQIYAAQSASQIYYLYHLGIADLRQELRQAFEAALPDARDAQLSGADFRNKLYGLTHVIIAASGFYQHFVDKDEFKWVYRYFEKRLDRIIEDAKPDIYAEVALCFLLAGDNGHPVVKRMKQALADAYNPRSQMVPSSTWGTDLAKGEHRNTLAIMVYRWPEKLYPGPGLWQYKHYREMIGRPGNGKLVE